MGVSKNKGTPKWMVKIMENPIKNGMIWGENPRFSETSISMDPTIFLPAFSAPPKKPMATFFRSRPRRTFGFTGGTQRGEGSNRWFNQGVPAWRQQDDPTRWWLVKLQIYNEHPDIVHDILHPGKLTCPLKRDYFNRKYIFQPLIFRGHVSFPGSIPIPVL